MLRVIVSMLAAVSIAVVPSTAWAGWNQPSGGPLDVVPAANAASSSLANVAGVPYAAWAESSVGRFQIFVNRLEGTTWVRVGGSLNVDPTDDATFPDIASVAGVPYVAWVEEPAAGHALLLVDRFVAGAWIDWTTVGESLNVNSAQDASSPTIASVGGAPVVVWQELNGAVFQIRFGRFNGTNWQALGGPLNVDPTQNATFADPALIAVGGVPYVTWQEAN